MVRDMVEMQTSARQAMEKCSLAGLVSTLAEPALIEFLASCLLPTYLDG